VEFVRLRTIVSKEYGVSDAGTSEKKMRRVTRSGGKLAIVFIL